MNYKIISWNVLAKEYCNAASFPKVLPGALDWNKRRALISDYLREHPVDVVYLTEVDTYDEFFKSLLTELNYHILTVYRSDVVACRQSLAGSPVTCTPYQKGAQFYLRIDLPGLLLFCTHFKSKFDPEPRAMRLSQAAQLRDAIDPLLGTHNVVVCGDFNDYPHSSTLETLSGGGLMRFSCTMTSFKIRATGRDKGVKDYFLVAVPVVRWGFGADVSTYNAATVARIDDERGLPNLEIPSDHLPLLLEITVTTP